MYTTLNRIRLTRFMEWNNNIAVANGDQCIPMLHRHGSCPTQHDTRTRPDVPPTFRIKLRHSQHSRKDITDGIFYRSLDGWSLHIISYSFVDCLFFNVHNSISYRFHCSCSCSCNIDAYYDILTGIVRITW